MGRLSFGVIRVTFIEGFCRFRVWEGVEVGVFIF